MKNNSKNNSEGVNITALDLILLLSLAAALFILL